MKIAVIAPTQIPARTANTLQVMKMTQAIAALGHSVRLAVPWYSAESTSVATRPATFAELARHYGLQHEFPIDWLIANPNLRRYDFGYRAAGWAMRLEAEVVYTRLPQAAATASGQGQKTILEVHDLPQGRFGPWLFRRFLRGRGAVRLVAITRSLAADLASQLGAPSASPFLVVAPDGVDLSRYQQLPEPRQARASLDELKPRGDRFTAGYTGHLYAGRGVELLLELAVRLPEIDFLLVGGEPADVARLQTEIQSRQLENVIATGFIPNADLPRYQAACDVLLMPYQVRVAASSGGDIARYLSPMKLFEYLACGRPILSSNLPVLSEVLNASNSILLPPDDVNSWATALTALQNDPQRRDAMSVQARQDAASYTWEARARRILEGLDQPHA
jgi:glycosyltransferase involved in cell wall biosynthesis